MPSRPITVTVAALVTVCLLAACGGGEDEDTATTTQGGPTTEATTTTTAPEGEVVLAETFDDDANGWAPEAFDTETTTGEIADGQLTFSVSDSPSAGLPEGQVALPTLLWPSVIEAEADRLADVRIDTTTSFTEGSQVGVSCRIVDPTGDDFRSYDFAVSSSGVVSIAEVDAEGASTTLARQPAAGDTDEATLPEDPAFDYDPNATYEIAAECTGGQDGEPAELALFLDGEEVLTAQDTEDPIPTGIASVSYGESNLLTEVNGFTPFGVAFDDWTLTDLGGGESAGSGDEGGQAAPFESSCDDTTDDLADDKGNPLEGLDDPGTDLVSVTLLRSEGVLSVDVQVDGDLPAEVSSVTDRPVRWGVAMDTEEQAILLETILDGDRFQARIADQAAGGTQLDLDPVVDGDTISFAIPLDEFPLPDEFSWNAFTEWYPNSGEAARVDDVCPNDFGDVAFG